MRLFGLIGYPLSHSFSQKYFTDRFLREGVNDCHYQNFPIADINELTMVLKNNPELEGFNITIPYKELVIKYLSEASDVVLKTGACNCVKIVQGKLYGHNTDVIGFEKSFIEFLRPHHNRALVLGTGGSSKAVQFVLNKLGIEFKTVSRSPQPGVLCYDEISGQLLQQYPVLINTTPLGLHPHTETFPALPYLSLTEKHYLFDLVYNPPLTRFLEKGKQAGAVIKNGSDMLVYQADESWKIWNN